MAAGGSKPSGARKKSTKVRALVANLDDDSALRAQISENMARRDLSYIEKALFAQELVRIPASEHNHRLQRC